MVHPLHLFVTGAGILAALLSGHTAISSDVLTQDGCRSLAALHASSYHLGNAGPLQPEWKGHLRAAGAAMVGSDAAYLTVAVAT